MRCRALQKRIDTHPTQDAATEAAAKILQVGKFPAGYSAVCNCSASNGKMKPADCDGLCVYDEDGEECARFKGTQYRAQLGADGGILVYSLPGATKDRAFNLGNALAALNRRNEDFWRNKNEGASE